MESCKLLVVEDEAVSALDIMETVEGLGHTVVDHVMTGSEAIAKAKEHTPDLILMDIKLKGEMDGIQAATTIWETQGIPIVFLTAFADEATLSRAKLAQPYGYVLKPFEEDDIRTSIELALHRRETELAKPSQKARTDSPRTIQEEISFGSKTLSAYDFLRRVDPFRSLPEDTLEEFSSACSFEEIAEGDVVVYQEEADFPGFIVAAGRIALVKSSSGGEGVDREPPSSGRCVWSGDRFGR